MSAQTPHPELPWVNKKTTKMGKDLVSNVTALSLTTDPALTNNSVVQKTLVVK